MMCVGLMLMSWFVTTVSSTALAMHGEQPQLSAQLGRLVTQRGDRPRLSDPEPAALTTQQALQLVLEHLQSDQRQGSLNLLENRVAAIELQLHRLEAKFDLQMDRLSEVLISRNSQQLEHNQLMLDRLEKTSAAVQDGVISQFSQLAAQEINEKLDNLEQKIDDAASQIATGVVKTLENVGKDLARNMSEIISQNASENFAKNITDFLNRNETRHIVKVIEKRLQHIQDFEQTVNQTETHTIADHDVGLNFTEPSFVDVMAWRHFQREVISISEHIRRNLTLEFRTLEKRLSSSISEIRNITQSGQKRAEVLWNHTEWKEQRRITRLAHEITFLRDLMEQSEAEHAATRQAVYDGHGATQQALAALCTCARDTAAADEPLTEALPQNTQPAGQPRPRAQLHSAPELLNARSADQLRDNASEHQTAHRAPARRLADSEPQSTPIGASGAGNDTRRADVSVVTPHSASLLDFTQPQEERHLASLAPDTGASAVPQQLTSFVEQLQAQLMDIAEQLEQGLHWLEGRIQASHDSTRHDTNLNLAIITTSLRRRFQELQDTTGSVAAMLEDAHGNLTRAHAATKGYLHQIASILSTLSRSYETLATDLSRCMPLHNDDYADEMSENSLDELTAATNDGFGKLQLQVAEVLTELREARAQSAEAGERLSRQVSLALRQISQKISQLWQQQQQQDSSTHAQPTAHDADDALW